MPDSTHWDNCWRVHHDCAIALIERLRDQSEYVAWMERHQHWFDGSQADD